MWVKHHPAGGGRDVCAPEVILAKHRFRAVEDPSTSGGSLRIISCPCDTDMLSKTPHDECQQDTMTPRTGIANVDMIAACLNLQGDRQVRQPPVVLAWLPSKCRMHHGLLLVKAHRKVGISNSGLEVIRWPAVAAISCLRSQFFHHSLPCKLPASLDTCEQE